MWNGSKFVYSWILPNSEGQTAVVCLNRTTHIARVASLNVLEFACRPAKGVCSWLKAKSYHQSHSILNRLGVHRLNSGFTRRMAQVLASSLNLVAGLRVCRLLAKVLEMQQDSGNPVFRLDWNLT